MSEWISVMCAVPEDCKMVLAFSEMGYMLTGFYSHDDDWWYDKDGEELVTVIDEVTHWRELPEPPTT